MSTAVADIQIDLFLASGLIPRQSDYPVRTHHYYTKVSRNPARFAALHIQTKIQFSEKLKDQRRLISRCRDSASKALASKTWNCCCDLVRVASGDTRRFPVAQRERAQDAAATSLQCLFALGCGADLFFPRSSATRRYLHAMRVEMDEIEQAQCPPCVQRQILRQPLQAAQFTGGDGHLYGDNFLALRLARIAASSIGSSRLFG